MTYNVYNSLDNDIRHGYGGRIDPMTLDSLLAEKAKSIPHKTCIKFNKRIITYAEMEKWTGLAAGGLQGLGADINDRVAILMDNCPEYVISYFAILRAGGIAVPVNTFLTAEEMAYILQDSGCRIIIHGNNFGSRIADIKKCVPWIKACTFDTLPHAGLKPHKRVDTDTAALIYTSGTTGFPKGAELTHFNLRSNVEACMKVINVSARDRILLFLPLFHSFSFTVCVLLPIYCGASIILLESVRPFSRVIASLLRDRITLFVAVPAVYNILARKKMPIYLKYVFRYLTRIRACVSGASALPPDTLHMLERYFKKPILEGYGLTEASPVVAVNPFKGVRKPGSVGPPLPGIEVDIVGEDGKSLPAGQAGHAGELIVRGPNVMKCYFKKEEETKQVLKNGWLYTGDIAKIDEDRYIYIVDRKKDIIIADGMNIYPAEVENAVMKLPGVEECAMIGMPDDRGSETAILFVKKKENAELTDTAIKDHLKERIARFKLPKKIIFVGGFPKTATGKIKKNELKKKWSDNALE